MRYFHLFPLIDAIGSLIFLLNAYFINSHPVFLIPGYLLISIFGEGQGVVCVCMAFIADITKKSLTHRTPQLAFGEASLHVSGAFGVFITSVLSTYLGFQAVFIFSICIDAWIFGYVWFYLSHFEENNCSLEEDVSLRNTENDRENEDKICNEHENEIHTKYFQRKFKKDSSETICLLQKETNQEEIVDEEMSSEKEEDKKILSSNNENKNTTVDNTNINKHIIPYIKAYLQKTMGIIYIAREKKTIAIVLLVGLFTMFGLHGDHFLQVLYLKAAPFNFSRLYIAYYAVLQSAARFTGTIVITQLFYHFQIDNDFILMLIGAISQTLAYMTVGLSTNTKEVFISNALSFALPIVMISVRSILTKQVPKDRYASVLSVAGSSSIFVGMIANVILSLTRRTIFENNQGDTYVVLAGFSAITIVIILVTYITIVHPQRKDARK